MPSKIGGIINAIPSKSDAHRCLICAALSNSAVKIVISRLSKDIEVTIDCLRKIGVEIIQNKEVFTVIPPKKYFINPKLDCYECGSTLRFLLPVVSAVCGEYFVTGTGKLPNRPLSPLREQMEQNGCDFVGDKLPITVKGKLKSGEFYLSGDVSSQFVSGLLMALPKLDGDSKIIITSPLQSKGYVDMTIKTLSLFGVKIEEIQNGYFIKGNQTFSRNQKLVVEGDWSNSAFWLCAGAISSNIVVKGLDINSLQGDKQIVDILKEFGANVFVNKKEIGVSYNKLNGIHIDGSLIPDIVPILSVVGAIADGETIIYNAKRLKIKESDRIKSVSDVLLKIGADITPKDDGFFIIGKKKTNGGVTISSFNDHRIVMMATIMAIICEKEIIIENAEAVNKSYPDFFEDFKMLGGKYNVV